MHHTFSILAILAASAQYVSARNSVHLVNGVFLNSSPTRYSSSIVVYCDDDSNCNHYPSGSNFCGTGGSPQGWEGSSQSCSFNTGVTFSWNIASSAQAMANYSPVGSGSNGGQQFTCYKDDQHAMWTQNGVIGKSIYYCL